MWDLPRPETEPGSPALADGFLTTGPPGKFSTHSFSPPLRAKILSELLTPYVISAYFGTLYKCKLYGKYACVPLFNIMFAPVYTIMPLAKMNHSNNFFLSDP